MSNWKLLSGVAAASLFTAAIVAPAEAQVTSSNVNGTVTTETGAPVSGATITITNPATGLTRSTTASATGAYALRGLPVSTLYAVTVTANDFQSQTVENVALLLGDATELNFALTSDDTRTLDTIVITASAADTATTAVGPSSTFDLTTLQNAPAANRSISDIVRLDPRVYVDEGGRDGVQCAGANPRYNSLTVDGVRLNDTFGLNDNGFPTERVPFSIDAINQVAVELAPFDVQYGGFSACNINAVTKSGTNEFHGSVFFDITNEDLTGDSLEGSSVRVEPFEETRYGGNIGGPIIKDKLFFFAAYEKLDGTNTFDRGPVGSGAVNEVEFLRQSDLDRIIDISNNVYNYDPGGVPGSLDVEDEKLLLKFDWNINDQHRAAFTYNYNDGFNFTESDGDNNEFELENHLYERGAELNSYVGTVYSDWTDNFSTELRYGYLELDNRQISIDTEGFSEVRIAVTNPDNNQRGLVYLGGDDSRQANELDYNVTSLAAKGFYDFDQHSLTFGYEREEVEIFNLFVQHYDGQIDFNSIDDFENLLFDDYDFQDSLTGNLASAGTTWSYALNTLYLQDDWAITPDFTLTAGLRYDFYESDNPDANPDFFDSYGFTNALSLDGESVLQPRLAFDWDVNDDLKLRGGVGIYSGGNPNVWLSNNFSNSNTRQAQVNENQLTGFDDQVSQLTDYVFVNQDGSPGTFGFDVPQELVDAVANGEGSPAFGFNVLDPNFEIPTETKYALGATYYLDLPYNNFLGGEYVLNGDILMSKSDGSFAIRRLELDVDGTTAGGLPTFAENREEALALSNGADQDALSISGTVSKSYDFGLDWTFGYAYNDAEQDMPMNSAVAFSNYSNRAYLNPNESLVATSDYNIEHRFTLNVNYETEFVEGYKTTIGAFGQARSGRPYSYVFTEDSGNNIWGFTPFIEDAPGSGGVLFYVPDGMNDPNVQFASGFDTAGLFDYINANDLSGYAGGFAPRNAFEGDWWTKLDVRIEQEFPGFRADDRSAAFLIIDNFTNLLNDEWGVLKDPDFPGAVAVVETDVTNVNGQDIFEFTDFVGEPATSPVGSASLWSIRFGVRYEF